MKQILSSIAGIAAIALSTTAQADPIEFTTDYFQTGPAHVEVPDNNGAPQMRDTKMAWAANNQARVHEGRKSPVMRGNIGSLAMAESPAPGATTNAAGVPELSASSSFSVGALLLGLGMVLAGRRRRRRLTSV